VPTAIDTYLMCVDSGVGGHHCNRSCTPLGPNERVTLLELAEKLAGGKLDVVGHWKLFPDDADEWTSRERASVKLHAT
jgi:hypothetical protein